MRRTICVVYLVFLLYQVAVVKTEEPGIFYLDKQCNNTLLITLDIRLKLTSLPHRPLEESWTCEIVVESSQTSSMMTARYRRLETEYSQNCEMNKLLIYDTDHVLLNGPDGDCGDVTPSTQLLSEGRLFTLEFLTNSQAQSGNFELLITPIVHSNGSNCPESMFHCNNDICVPMGVTCNGFNDCGDNSDEIDGCGTTPKVIVATIAGLLALAVLISLVIFLARWRRRKYYRVKNVTDHDSHHHHHHKHHGNYQTLM